MKCFLNVAVLALSIFYIPVKAQLPECDPTVPYFQLDLTGQPAGSWTSPWHVRQGNCCNTVDPIRCTSFEVLLDAGAAMINFEIVGGAIPSGAMFYQVNCGPQVPVGDPICISGVGPHHVTFCKPGNNENNYRITSIPVPTFPADDHVRIGCSKYLPVLGLETNTLTWTSVAPGTPGQYDSYLSCTSACTTPLYTPASNAPAYVDYKICGFPIADECGYSSTCDTIRIYNLPQLTGTVSPATAAFCSGGPGVVISANPAGGNGNYTYIWRNSSGTIVGTSVNYTANVAGTYSVEIRDGLYDPALCPPVLLSVPVIAVLPPQVTAGPDQVHCADNPSSILEATALHSNGIVWSGGSGTYSPDQFSSSVSYTPTASEIAAGGVTLTVSSNATGGGCPSSSDQVTIQFPQDIDIQLPPVSGNCFGSIVVLNPVVSGGAGALTYQWNTGASSTSIQTTGGNYCVRVEDTLGCFAMACSNVTVPSPMGIYLSSTDATSGSNGTASVTIYGGTPPYSYQWNDPALQTHQNATGLNPGMYSIGVTDANGCFISSSVIVNNLFCSGFQASASGMNVSCNGKSDGIAVAQTTGGTSPYNYSWQGFSTNNDTLSGIGAGTYLVIITDGNGCQDAATITIFEPMQLTNTISSTDVSTSGGNDGSATSNVFGGTGTIIYQWSDGSTSSSVSGLSAGTYSVHIIDGNGCSLTDLVQINDPSCNNLVIGSYATASTCFNTSNGTASAVILSGTAPFSYSWSNGATTSSISGLAAGVYTVNVTDASGCSTFKNVTVLQPSPLSSSLAATHPTCHLSNNGTIEHNISGGTYPYQFFWTNGAHSEDLYNIPPGTYSVNIVDANGCSTSVSTTLIQPVAISVDVTMQNVSCTGGSDGSADIDATGGTGTLSFMWNTGQTTEDLNGVVSGLYTLVVTDQNGCTNHQPIEVYVNQPLLLEISQVLTEDIPCHGYNSGSIDLLVSGGTSPYTYQWSNGSVTEDLTELTSGTYSVTIIDANACQTFTTVTLVQPDSLHGILTAQDVLCNGVNNGFIDAQISGGMAPYTFQWNTGSTTEDINLLAPGAYTLLCTDINGCVTQLTGIVSERSPLTASPLIKNVTCNSSNDASIILDLGGGTAPYNVVWSNGSETPMISSLTPGTYSVTITDANGCMHTDAFTITEPDVLNLTAETHVFANGHNTSYFGSNDGEVTLTVTGGTQPYTYLWSDGSTSSSLTNAGAGNYEVLVTDANGCTYRATFILSQPHQLDMPEGISPNGDGRNDKFDVLGIEAYPDNNITVMNRWGNEVYSTQNYQNTWTGENKNGDALPKGTYFVILEIHSPEKIILKGYVEIK
jgi:gliding motility-associated-like protein